MLLWRDLNSKWIPAHVWTVFMTHILPFVHPLQSSPLLHWLLFLWQYGQDKRLIRLLCLRQHLSPAPTFNRSSHRLPDTWILDTTINFPFYMPRVLVIYGQLWSKYNKWKIPEISNASVLYCTLFWEPWWKLIHLATSYSGHEWILPTSCILTLYVARPLVI